MNCQYCNNSVPAGSTTCPHCGAPAPAQPAAPPQEPVSAQPPVSIEQKQTENSQQAKKSPNNFTQDISPRTRSIFIVLGVLLGSLGIHNFYAGYIVRGLIQLLLMIFSEGYAYPILLVWNIVEVIVVKKDSRGRPFIRA